MRWPPQSPWRCCWQAWRRCPPSTSHRHPVRGRAAAAFATSPALLVHFSNNHPRMFGRAAPKHGTPTHAPANRAGRPQATVLGQGRVAAMAPAHRRATPTTSSVSAIREPPTRTAITSSTATVSSAAPPRARPGAARHPCPCLSRLQTPPPTPNEPPPPPPPPTHTHTPRTCRRQPVQNWRQPLRDWRHLHRPAAALHLQVHRLRVRLPALGQRALVPRWAAAGARPSPCSPLLKLRVHAF